MPLVSIPIAVQVGVGRRRSWCRARVGLGRRFSAFGLASRHPSVPVDVLQLHRQARSAYLLAQRPRPDDADKHAARIVRQRGFTRSGRRLRASLRSRSDRCVRRDPRAGSRVNRQDDMPSGALGLAPRPRCRSSTTRATRSHAPTLGRPGGAGPETREEKCRRDRQHRQGRSGPFEGYYNNEGRHCEDDPLRLVLVGRPRLQGSAGLPLLRGPQTGRTGIRVDGREPFPPVPIGKRRCARLPASCSPAAYGRSRRPGRRPGGWPGSCRPEGRRVRIRRAFGALARRTGRDRPEVAAGATVPHPARSRRPRAPNKIVKRTLVHQKVSGPTRVGGDAAFVRRPRRRRLPAVHCRRRSRAARVVRCDTDAKRFLGPLVEPVVPPPEGAGVFATEVRDWLAAHVEVPARFENIADEVEFRGAPWQAQLAAQPLGRHPLGRSTTAGRGRVAGASRDLQHGSTHASRCAANRSTGSASTSPGRRSSPTARKSRSSGGCRRSSRPAEIWCQLFSEARRRLRPRVAEDGAPSASTRAGCLSGPEGVEPRTRSSARVGGSASPAPTPERPEAQGHLVSHSRHGNRPGHRGAALGATHGRRRVQRGVSSTRCFVPDDQLVGALHKRMGGRPTRRSRTSGAPRSRSKSKSCTRCYLD